MEKAIDALPARNITPDVTCDLFSEGKWQREKVSVPGEMPLTIFLNGRETVTILCTPARLTHLVLGFLYLEGIINDMKEVNSLRICEDEPIADVRLNKTDFKEPPRRTLSSGCGSGVSFNPDGKKVESDLTITPGEVLALMKQLYQQQDLFQIGGGIHSSALCNREQILALAEDIGRHNTLDKIMGECLMRKLPTRDCLLLTTGRISSEMLLKASKMNVPIVVSRGSPTELSVSLGKEMGITVIGYSRGNRLSVFSGAERIAATNN